ncbi:MAG: aminoacyl-tRNA hydrolase [Candidatus Altiarchaeales archaeon IMC4]|nr:MAG: aminoacyl-tRNA hydrolase [Candidatus Altiarchaeales archaeon IMC4]
MREKILGGSAEYKQAIVVRSDLKLSKGKLAGQVAHASVSAAEKSRYKKEWLDGQQKKVVLKCENTDELFRILQSAKDAGIAAALIKDAGHTEIAPGTITCVGIGPAPEKEIDKVTGDLKLL